MRRRFAVSTVVLSSSIAFAVACGSAGGTPLGTGEQAAGAPGNGGSYGTANHSSSTGGSGASFVGGGGTTTSTGTGGAGGGVDVTGGGGAPECASQSYGGELVPLDMIILLDRSGSMQDNNKWGNVTSAINQFCNLPSAAGIGVGLQFFAPLGQAGNPPGFCSTDQDCGAFAPCEAVPGTPFGVCVGGPECDYHSYSTLAVPIGQLPGNASAVQSAIASAQPDSDTPTTSALQGVLFVALDWAMMHPDHTTMVVLATDGEPSACGDSANNVNTAAMYAMQGVTLANPQIKTFVIGVGSSLSNLNTIAQAGGTDQALIVDATNDAAKQFADALDKIRGSVACDFKIPTPMDGTTVDYGKVNVQYTPSGGMPTTLYQVAGKDMCGVNGGWYYDNPTTPTKIVLCDATCAGVKQDAQTSTGAKVDVTLGCKTMVQPMH